MVPKLKLKTAPSGLILEVENLKNYLRNDVADDDALIGALIKAATARVEKYLDQKLLTQTWLVYFDHLPGGSRLNEPWWDGVREIAINEVNGGRGRIKLPIGPVQSVVEFNTYADDDTKVLFASSQYQVDTVDEQGAVALRMGAVWPTTVLRPINGIEIEVVCGYGDAEDVPTEIVEAIKITVAKLYENRGDFKAGEEFTLPATAQLLLEPYRKIKVGGC